MGSLRGRAEFFLEKNWKTVLLIVIACVVVLELFLVQDFDFFWEDYGLLGLSIQTNFGPTNSGYTQGATRVYDNNSTAVGAANQMLRNFFNIHSTFSMGRHGANLASIYSFMGALFTDNLMLYRFLSLACLSFLVILIFNFFRKSNSIFFGILAISLYVSFPQVWQVVVSPTWLITTLMMHVLTVSALYLFYFFYQQNLSRFKTLFVFLMIVLLTRFSMLIKQEGRIVFVILFLYLTINGWQKLKKLKNVTLLVALFITTFPFSTGLASFKQNAGSATSASVLADVLSNVHKLLFIYGAVNIFSAIFILGLIIFLFFVLKKKHALDSMHDKLNIAIFSLIWFFCALMMPVLAKGLTPYGPQSWLIIDFFYSLFPFVVFLFFGFSLIVDTTATKRRNVVFVFICLIFIISLSVKLVALNRFVGAHNTYFIGYDTVADFLDSKQVKNSVILSPFDSFTAQAQVNTPTNYVSARALAHLKNVTFLKATKGNLSDLYVISHVPIEFSEPKRIITVKTFKPRTNSVYLKLKNLLGVDTNNTTFYLYKLQ